MLQSRTWKSFCIIQTTLCVYCSFHLVHQQNPSSFVSKFIGLTVSICIHIWLVFYAVFLPFSKRNRFFFTYMIKSGFLEDFVPFASVYCCLLISFTTIMFMLFMARMMYKSLIPLKVPYQRCSNKEQVRMTQAC